MEKSDKKLGKYVQRPNAPIITWAVTTIAAKLSSGTWMEFFDVIAFGSLFTWAWLEIFKGTNNFRRVLGAVVITISVYSKIS